MERDIKALAVTDRQSLIAALDKFTREMRMQSDLGWEVIPESYQVVYAERYWVVSSLVIKK